MRVNAREPRQPLTVTATNQFGRHRNGSNIQRQPKGYSNARKALTFDGINVIEVLTIFG
tara:strand:+ start:255 stop:431 length:177 start_codon:yes stop_codon:yes gene_type:complete